MNPSFTSTRNACKLCSPLGASLVFKGIEGCVPMIHGSQGCATYIRRYVISHFKEPMDIASSNFSEESTIFGGNKNFRQGIENLVTQYNPSVIGIASTCLSETIGEDIPMLIHEYRELNSKGESPIFIHASTPSYSGTHMDGFHQAVHASVATLAKGGAKGNHVNLFCGMVSPADMRHLKYLLDCFDLPYVLFPDYSDTLDNPNWSQYQIIPEGGTSIAALSSTGQALATVELGSVFSWGSTPAHRNTKPHTAGEYLLHKFKVPCLQTGLPIGIDATDAFIAMLEEISGKPAPFSIKRERGRLVDAYVDGHKYVFGKRAIVYGEEDLVIGIVRFLNEIGVETILAGSGGESNRLASELEQIGGNKSMRVVNGLDFETINDMADELKPDILIGNSKGYYIARRLGIPIVRIGFPVHDRFGAQRYQHLGYQGTQQLFDRVVNALIEYKQENSPVGYKYI